MVVGEKLMFYHSNCKNPGIAGFAKVSKEAYPDYTAWDSAHPYFDPKTDKDKPKWFMIDATFVSRARHFVPLSLLRYIADLPSSEPPEEVGYVGASGVKAIKAMPLVTRGRLSVQRVPEECWAIIEMMAARGGWEDMSLTKKKAVKTRQLANETKSTSGGKKGKKKEPVSEGNDSADEVLDESQVQSGVREADEPEESSPPRKGRKRKASEARKQEDEEQDPAPRRKSTRTKR
ncbi:hypothetical protein HYDPIDRAFT_104586 [Hydnomerulius pinastri MD-312]|nr:hypothetical protein HYDPIDRAFT_104586 [Hydnomerulius pinastri MD-312]